MSVSLSEVNFMLRDGKKGKKDNSPTPKWFYQELDKEFHFDFDPCPINPEDLRSQDGLGSEWGLRNFVNPPYSKKRAWMEKAIVEQNKGKLIVMLLPVDTSTGWFHDLLLPNADIRWLRGRLRLDNGNHPVYASMLAIFRPKNALKENGAINQGTK